MSSRHRMWSLAEQFPTLREWAEYEQSADFDGDIILAALREPWVTTGSRYALLFLADVWNSTEMRKQLPRALQRWSIADAFASWDDAHRTAALSWLRSPWWP